MCVVFWVLPRRLIIECRRFGTLYLFHLQRLDTKCDVYFTLHIQPLKMEQIECSETSAFNNQTPGKYPKDYTQYCDLFHLHVKYRIMPHFLFAETRNTVPFLSLQVKYDFPFIRYLTITFLLLDFRDSIFCSLYVRYSSFLSITKQLTK